jgi:hypothetical protein
MRLVYVTLIPATIPNLFSRFSKVLRAFRVIRLFGRLKSLRNIVQAISLSIVPVLNAFVIIYLVASICLNSNSSPYISFLNCCILHSAHFSNPEIHKDQASQHLGKLKVMRIGYQPSYGTRIVRIPVQLSKQIQIDLLSSVQQSTNDTPLDRCHHGGQLFRRHCTR